MENWIEKAIESLKNMPDSAFEEIMKNEEKKEREKLKTILNDGGDILKYIFNTSTQSRLSDGYIDSENEEENRLENLVSIVAITSLDYARIKHIDISTNEFFFTERCFVLYEDILFQIEEVHGQGTYEVISVAKEIEKHNTIHYNNVLNWIKECLNDKEEIK